MISLKELTLLLHASVPAVKWRCNVEELFIVFPVRGTPTEIRRFCRASHTSTAMDRTLITSLRASLASCYGNKEVKKEIELSILGIYCLLHLIQPRSAVHNASTEALGLHGQMMKDRHFKRLCFICMRGEKNTDAQQLPSIRNCAVYYCIHRSPYICFLTEIHDHAFTA